MVDDFEEEDWTWSEEGEYATVVVECPTCHLPLFNSWIPELGGAYLAWICKDCHIEYPCNGTVSWEHTK